MCSEADRHPTWAPNNNFPVSPSRRQFERGQSGNAQPCAAQLPPRSSLTRVEVESKEWARGGGVAKRDLPPNLGPGISEVMPEFEGSPILVHAVSDLLISVCATGPCTARASGS